MTEQSLVSFNVYHTRAIRLDVIQKVWARDFGKRVQDLLVKVVLSPLLQ